METPFHWEKLGQVYRPPRDGSWRHGFGQAPSVAILPDRLRVFITVRPRRDTSGAYVSHMSYVDVALDDPMRVIGEAPAPLLELGRPGTFDHHGSMPGCVAWDGDRLLLYYCGWLRLVGVPYAVSIGVTVSGDGGRTFSRLGEGPLFSRTLREPFQENSPYVVRAAGVWHMWYGSGTDWVAADDGRMEAIYVIKHARSEDGMTWQRDGLATIPTVVRYECQARPMVMQFGNRWAMWFCYREGVGFRSGEGGYRIGFAYSDDLITWQRNDALAGLSVSAAGWDSEAVCYPLAFRLGDDVFMYYNGNAFGEDGFGCAKLVSAPPGF